MGMKKRVRLDSSAIAVVAYDSETRNLEIQFRGGDNYRYLNVPKFVLEALLKAESAGAF